MRPADPAPRPAIALFSALCALGLLPGCGSSSPAAISAATATTLHRDVQSIRSAAAGRDARIAHAALDALRGDVGRLVARGELARSDAHVLTIEADQLDSRVSVELRSASSTPATPQPNAVSPSTRGAGSTNGISDGNGNGHGKGHGHGHGGGDGRD